MRLILIGLSIWLILTGVLIELKNDMSLESEIKLQVKANQQLRHELNEVSTERDRLKVELMEVRKGLRE